jgi:hypothetical protein
MTRENRPGHFPGVRVKPLCHLSTATICRTNALPGQAESLILGVESLRCEDSNPVSETTTN